MTINDLVYLVSHKNCLLSHLHNLSPKYAPVLSSLDVETLLHTPNIQKSTTTQCKALPVKERGIIKKEREWRKRNIDCDSSDLWGRTQERQSFFQRAHSAEPQKPNYVWKAFNASYYTAGDAVIQLIVNICNTERLSMSLQSRNVQLSFCSGDSGEAKGLMNEWRLCSYFKSGATQEWREEWQSAFCQTRLMCTTAVWTVGCQLD